MPRTDEDRDRWCQQAYGCSEAELATAVEDATKIQSRQMTAMSMLSDAQEEIAMGMQERARQTINRAKWVIASTMTDR